MRSCILFFMGKRLNVYQRNSVKIGLNNVGLIKNLIFEYSFNKSTSYFNAFVLTFNVLKTTCCNYLRPYSIQYILIFQRFCKYDIKMFFNYIKQLRIKYFISRDRSNIFHRYAINIKFKKITSSIGYD